MPTYAIGDIQGCHAELLDLLDAINYDERRDRLWFTGDLVNRGPQSLASLRFVRRLGGDPVIALGNHDLHLLAVHHDRMRLRPKDTFGDVLEAPDRDDLLRWLRHRPLLHHDIELGYTLVHAGLPPQWDLALATDCARELEQALRGERYTEILDRMYGNTPDCWSANLEDWDRLRFSINCFTRLRFCDAAGCLALEEKGPPGSQAAGYRPWFEIADRRSRDLKIIFGHWSTLRLIDDNYEAKGVFPLDTGCVWGGALTALRLEDRRYFSVPSRQPKYKC